MNNIKKIIGNRKAIKVKIITLKDLNNSKICKLKVKIKLTLFKNKK